MKEAALKGIVQPEGLPSKLDSMINRSFPGVLREALQSGAQ